MSDDDRSKKKAQEIEALAAAQEIDALAADLGAWVSTKAPAHDVSMPFALARILYEVVAHDGGDIDDCLELVKAAGKRGIAPPTTSDGELH